MNLDTLIQDSLFHVRYERRLVKRTCATSQA